MKKKTLVSAVLAATIMGTTSVSLAAENMFSDVPLDHWAYDAIAKLAEDGIIEGYGDTGFGGDKAITRYEMAQLVAKAQANQENARAVDKAAIEKLQQEFDSELKGEVQNLRKDVDDLKSRMGWYGDARVRFFTNKSMKSSNGTSDRYTSVTDSSSQFEKRLRLGFWASPAENLSVDGRLKYEDNSWTRAPYHDDNENSNHWNGTVNNQNSVRLDKLSLNWNRNNTKVSVGRTEVSLGQGLLWWENPVDGFYVKQQFGPKFSAMVGVGDISAEGWQDTNMNAQFAELAYQASPATRITLANMRTLSNSQIDASPIGSGSATLVDSPYRLNQFSIGVNTQVAPKWNVIAEAVTNNVGQPGNSWSNSAGANTDEKLNKHGFWTRVTYGKQEWNKANTWQVYGEYFALGNASVDSRYWGHRLNIAGGNSKWENGGAVWGDGARGFGFGASYMLASNTNLELTYYKLKPYDENAAGFTKYDDVAYAALTYSF